MYGRNFKDRLYIPTKTQMSFIFTDVWYAATFGRAPMWIWIVSVFLFVVRRWEDGPFEIPGDTLLLALVTTAAFCFWYVLL